MSNTVERDMIETDYQECVLAANEERRMARAGAEHKALISFDEVHDRHYNRGAHSCLRNTAKDDTSFNLLYSSVCGIEAVRRSDLTRAETNHNKAMSCAILDRNNRTKELSSRKTVGCTLSFGGGTTFPVFTNDSLGAEWDGAIVDIYASHGGRPIALGAIVTNIEQKENI